MPDPEAAVRTLLALLGPGDDPELWLLAAAKGIGQAGGLLDGLAPRPRHLIVTFAAIPPRHPETHPDEGALWRQSFSATPGVAAWRDEGAAPRVRRKRGHFSLTVCIPTGTRRLAAVEVVCLWRPRFPWAAPQDTGIGREIRVFLRDGSGAWAPRGVHG